jgi:hypothetical protein
MGTVASGASWACGAIVGASRACGGRAVLGWPLLTRDMPPRSSCDSPRVPVPTGTLAPSRTPTALGTSV